MKTKKPNATGFRDAADRIFMTKYRGLPCEICGTTEGTAFHHVVGRNLSRALRYEDRNGIVLCQNCHTQSNDVAAHSTNAKAVQRFNGWFMENHFDRYEWIEQNRNIERRFTYQEAVKNLLAGREAWENE